MKKLLTILFLIISTITFAQTPLVIKVSGSGSSGGNNDPDSLNGKAGHEYLLTVVADAAYKPITYVPSWSDITGKPTFATVATSGSYNDLNNRPTIVDYVSTITALENYTGSAKTIIVQDTLRGGTFNFNSVGIPDSGTVFNAFGGGYWLRNYKPTEVNVHWFGAIGDGSDATNAIQLAIYSVDVNKGKKGGSVYFPSGVYTISSPVTLGSYVNMHGDYWNSFLQLANGANCNMFANPTNASINYIKIYDLELYGNSGNNTSGSAISITYNGYNNSDIYFTRLLIAHFKENGIYIENGWQYHIESSILEFFGKYGLKLQPTLQADPSAASAEVARVFIQNSSILVADSACIYANGSSNRWILGLNINNNHIGRYGVDTSSRVHIRGVKDFVITSNRIYGAPTAGNTTYDIITVDSNSNIGIISNNTITNLAEYYNTVTTPIRYGVSVWDTCNNITISKNQFFKNSTKQNVYVAPTAYLITTDSTLNDSLMALKQHSVTLTTIGSSGAATFNQGTGALNIPNYAGSGGGGISKVVAGYGQSQVNDSTTKVDTTIIASKNYLSNYLLKTGGDNLGYFGFGKTFSNHGGYGNYLDIAGGITMQRPSDAVTIYLLTTFDASGSILGYVYIPASTHNMLFETLKSDGYIMFNPGNGNTYNTGNFNPNGANIYSLGTPTYIWSNVYTDNVTLPYVSTATSLTATSSNSTIEVTATGQTITLPTAVGIKGKVYTIIYTASSGTATIATTSSQTYVNITGTPTTLTLSAPATGATTSYTLTSNGANWVVTSKVKND